METTIFRVYTANPRAYASTDIKKDFYTFEEAMAYATKKGDYVTGFKKITTSDVEWRA